MGSDAIPLRLPHADPLRLLTRLRTRDEDGIVAEACVPAASPAASDGCVRAAYLVEIAAQAAAAWAGAAAGAAEGGPNRGVLAAVHDWRDAAPARCGRTIRVQLRRAHVLGALARWDCRLEQGGVLLASGAITVHSGG